VEQPLATVVVALAGALLVRAAWRARAVAARRREVRRTLKQLAEDASSLLAAMLLSLDRRDPAEVETEYVEIAREAAGAAARLLEVARAYAGHPEHMIQRADGCVRVAIGILRSRGVRVRLTGVRTDLVTSANVGETLGALLSLFEHVHGTARSSAEPTFIDVELGPEHVLVALGPVRRSVPTAQQTATTAELGARAGRCGWALHNDSAGALTLRSASPPAAPTKPPRATARWTKRSGLSTSDEPGSPRRKRGSAPQAT
jgi:hypothetical protein